MPAFNDWLLRIPWKPEIAAKHTPLPHSGVVGVAVNGVLFMHHKMTKIFDNCMGHIDGHHRYHYHLAPTCLINSLNGTASSTWWVRGSWPPRAKPSPLIGWALDGWPIFGPYDESGLLMTRATLDRCSGKELPGGRYAYFTTPEGGIACFVGRPGEAINRGLLAPARRCPAGGLRSAYCAGPAGCPELKVKACERCKQVFFLFPACPKVGPKCVLMARLLGTLYLALLLALFSGGPLRWLFQRWTGRNMSAIPAICRQTDDEWRPCLVRPIAEKTGGVHWLDWVLVAVLQCSPRFVDLVRQVRDLMFARVMQALRGAGSICLGRCLFLLIDPWHVNELLPPIIVGPLYGVVYPTLNWNFVQSMWLLVLRSGMVSMKHPEIAKALGVSLILEYLVQLIADLLRAFHVNPKHNTWLMICQLYFLTFGILTSLVWFGLIPRILRKLRNFQKHEQKMLRRELLMMSCISAVKLAHSVFSIVALVPGGLPGDMPVWLLLFVKEAFVFLEFKLLLAHVLVTVYHAAP